MAKITVELPDNLLEEIIQGISGEELLADQLPELLRLGLLAKRSPSNVYKYILDFIVSNPTHEEILAFRPTLVMQERLKSLLTQSTAGQLTFEENQELDEYEQVEHLVIMLKSGSLKYLKSIDE
jgi:hypothetical protein